MRNELKTLSKVLINMDGIFLLIKIFKIYERYSKGLSRLGVLGVAA